MKGITVKLYLNGHPVGTFTSIKAASRYIADWEESYYNSDERDPNEQILWSMDVL